MRNRWVSVSSGSLPHSLVLQRAVNLIVTDGAAAPRTVHTAALTVGDGLWRLGYQLYAGDAVTPSLDTPIAAGLAVQVIRARPVARLRVRGRKL